MKISFLSIIISLLLVFQLLSAQVPNTNQPETETELTNWLKDYIPEKYPNSSYDPHHGWYQVFIPEYELTISWGLNLQKEIALKMVEGLSEDKSIFIAKEAKVNWANNSKIDYFSGVGYNISEYTSSTMGEFNVGQLTIVQFDGNPKKFIKKMVKAYDKETGPSKLTFHHWLKEYVKVSYPNLKINFHGGWYQSHIKQPELTVTWGTMAKTPMALKDLLVRPEKTIIIEQDKSVGWEKHPGVEFIKGLGYYLSKYDTSTMNDFEVGAKTVIQFDGENAREFTEEMAKSWARDHKYRVIMCTDFPPIGVVKEGDVPNTLKSDPDDMQTMVRFLLHANEFDVEGLVASAGTFAMVAKKENILSVLDQYEKVYDNLKTYDPDYPTADYLRSVTYEGRGNNNGVKVIFGCGKQKFTDIIGEGKDSEASNAIIAAADKPDPRPLWIGVWGGPRDVAQAIWKVKNTRSETELKAFISKLRVFLIYCQDATHEWLMNEFPDLFIIESKKTYQGMFGGDDPLSDLAWVNKNIRFNHGPLCAVYPHEGMGCTGVCEGDTPAFLHLLSANRGINNPEDPTQPGWGGSYVRKGNTNHYVDGLGESSISQWRADYQKEFKERADRCIKPKPDTSLPFMRWLYEYIPAIYPKAIMTDHRYWLQAHIGEDLVVNWAQINDGADLHYLEGHNLIQGQAFFIEKGAKLYWVDNPAVSYFEGAGYYVSAYDSATMRDWNIERCSVVQFDGDGRAFTEKMTKAWTQSFPTLKELFMDDFLIGGALNRDLIAGKDPKAAEIAAIQYNSATAENAMKWALIHPKLGEYNWGPADTFMMFCEEHEMTPIGHTLVWKSQVPGWVFKDDSEKPITRQALLNRMEDHVSQVVGRYKGRIKGWDVVNEALNDDGTMREVNWCKIIGEGDESKKFDHIEYAFRYAHAADPEAELYYNDYNLDTKRAKCDAAVEIVKHLQSKGIRIDGVGIQLHAGLAGDTYPQVEDLEYAITSFAALGLKVMVTELDMKTKRSGYRGADVSIMNHRATQDPNALTAETQKMLAEKYAEIFKVILRHKKDISRVTLWGVYDGRSWISGSPLLFDREYQPKEAFYSVIKTGLESNFEKK